MPEEAGIDADVLERLARDKAVPVGLRAARPPTVKASQPDEQKQDDGIPSWAAKATEELLVPTFWLDPGEQGEPFTAVINFSGQRVGVTGKPQPEDSFWRQVTVDAILPGSGPVAITEEIRGIAVGEWAVTASPAKRRGASQNQAQRVPWPRSFAIPATSATRTRTKSLLFSKVPGVIRYAYPILVSAGVLAGLGLIAFLLSHANYPVRTPVLLAVAAIATGVVGGKSWYIAVHRGRKRDGWCIQGFVAGACVVVGAAALAGPGVPPGVYLAAAAPALLTGMAIGRLGCFWAGCCTGRPTTARWGIWSSDRRIGCRRAPVQLMEAATALVIGMALLAVVLADGLTRTGPVAIAGLAAYTLIRQFILGLRAEPRQWRHGRLATGAIAAAMLIASVILLA